jgi:hypothetical protein
MARIHSILSTSTSRRPSILLTKKGMSPTVTRNLKMRTRINKNLLQLKTHTDHPFFVVVPGRCRNGSAGRATHSPLLPSPLRPPPSPKNADAIGMTRSSGTASSSPPPPRPHRVWPLPPQWRSGTASPSRATREEQCGMTCSSASTSPPRRSTGAEEVVVPAEHSGHRLGGLVPLLGLCS